MRIINYNDFDLINEDWKDDLINNAYKFSSNIVDIVDINNVFDSLINECGFVITSILEVGYIESGKVYFVSRKADFLKNVCFAVYNIKLVKSLKHDKNVVEFRNSLKLVESYLDKYDLCCRRLRFQDIKFIKSEPNLSSNQLRFDMCISVGDSLPNNLVEIGANSRVRMGRTNILKVVDKLNNNKIFNTVRVNGDEIFINIDSQYSHLNIESILNRITRDMDCNIHQGDNGYKIVFK